MFLVGVTERPGLGISSITEFSLIRPAPACASGENCCRGARVSLRPIRREPWRPLLARVRSSRSRRRLRPRVLSSSSSADSLSLTERRARFGVRKKAVQASLRPRAVVRILLRSPLPAPSISPDEGLSKSPGATAPAPSTSCQYTLALAPFVSTTMPMYVPACTGSSPASMRFGHFDLCILQSARPSVVCRPGLTAWLLNGVKDRRGPRGRRPSFRALHGRRKISLRRGRPGLPPHLAIRKA